MGAEISVSAAPSCASHLLFFASGGCFGGALVATGAADALQRMRSGRESKGPADFYDYILPFTTLSCLLHEKVLRVTTSGNPRSFIDAYASKVVTVLGSSQVGKTWVLNQIFGTNLPMGRRTDGLAMLRMDDLTVIDSPGLTAGPCDKLDDAMKTEAFLLSLLCELSQLCILVVDEFGPTEAGYLQGILSSKNPVDCVVVHNMNTIGNGEAASMEFMRRLRTLQVENESPASISLLRAAVDSGRRVVKHVGLCRDDCHAVNTPNAAYLRQLLPVGKDVNKDVKLAELVSTRLATVLGRFVHKAVAVDLQQWTDKSSALTRSEYPWLQYLPASQFTFEPSEVDEQPVASVRACGDRRLVEIACPGAEDGDVTVKHCRSGVQVEIQWPPGTASQWKWSYAPPAEEGVWSFDSARFQDGQLSIALRTVDTVSPKSAGPGALSFIDLDSEGVLPSPTSLQSPSTKSPSTKSPSTCTVASEVMSVASDRDDASHMGFHIVADEMSSSWVMS